MIRNTLAALILITSLGVGSAKADLVLDRIWSSGDFAYALVTYTNKSNTTFQTAVTIKCIAYNKEKQKLGTNTRSFFVHQVGSIKPGFNDTVKVPIQLNGAKMNSIGCSVRES